MIGARSVIEQYQQITRDLTATEQVIVEMAERATDLPHIDDSQVQLPDSKHVRVRPGIWSVPFSIDDGGETIDLLALAYCGTDTCLLSVFLDTPRGLAVYPVVLDQRSDQYCLHDVPSPMNRERLPAAAVFDVLCLAQAAVSAACISILDAPESKQ